MVPYSPAVHHAIGAAELAQMKPTATLTNIARGGVVDDAWVQANPCHKHLGLYAYRADFLENFVRLAPGRLEQIAREAGLEWIQSDAARVAQVQADIAAEPQPVHVPREPKPVVLVDEGPLVLVETRKDLRDVSLPFENR